MLVWLLFCLASGKLSNTCIVWICRLNLHYDVVGFPDQNTMLSPFLHLCRCLFINNPSHSPFPLFPLWFFPTKTISRLLDGVHRLNVTFVNMGSWRVFPGTSEVPFPACFQSSLLYPLLLSCYLGCRWYIPHSSSLKSLLFVLFPTRFKAMSIIIIAILEEMCK